MVTASQLSTVFPNAREPKVWADALNEAWEEFGIVSKNARAGFMGITGNETGGYVATRREDMRYSQTRAEEMFVKARKYPEVCRDRCASVPQDKGLRFASWIYADMYGNGKETTQDGWRFRGGGPIQLTFRSTYESAASAIDVDLVNNPDLIVEPRTGALAAAWFVTKYKPAILPLLNSDDEADFLKGAALVGWAEPAARERRLNYRRAALAVVKGTATLNVKALQRALMSAGFPLPRFGADGDFGTETRTALEAFQRANGLPVTGVADDASLARLGLA